MILFYGLGSFCVIGHSASDEIVVNTGAPLGCALSPIIFSIYTNDKSFNN